MFRFYFVEVRTVAIFWHLGHVHNGDAIVAAGALSLLMILLKSDQPALQLDP